MNLGRPPCIPDAHVEVNLREIAPPIPPTVRQAVQDYALELAIVQSYIIDLQLSKATLTPNDLNNRISNILQLMENIWKMIQEVTLLIRGALYLYITNIFGLDPFATATHGSAR